MRYINGLSGRVSRVWAWLSAACIILLSCGAGAATRRLSLEEAVRMALEQNVEVQVQGTAVEAARARLAGASLLLQQNPSLGVSAGPRSRPNESSVDYELELSQPIEIAGQRSARIDLASTHLLSEQAQLRASRIAAAFEARAAFVRSLAASRTASLAEDAVQLAERTVDSIQRRLEAGAATRLEVNAAMIELGRARRAARAAGLDAVQGLSELRTVLGLPVTEEIELEGELSPAPPESATALSQLLERAADRPDLTAARQEVEAARAEARLARREAFPTPRLGARYGNEEGAHVLQGVLNLDLPVFNRNQAARGVATARVAQAERLQEAVERRVAQEVRLAASRLAAAESTVAEYSGGVLDAIEENVALTQAAYEAGKIGLLELLLIRRDALDARRGYVEALAQLHVARAGLGRALGSLEPAP